MSQKQEWPQNRNFSVLQDNKLLRFEEVPEDKRFDTKKQVQAHTYFTEIWTQSGTKVVRHEMERVVAVWIIKGEAFVSLVVRIKTFKFVSDIGRFNVLGIRAIIPVEIV